MTLCTLRSYSMRRHTRANKLCKQDRDRDSKSLLLCFPCVLLATNQCCREEPCLNSHYCAQQRQLSFSNHWLEKTKQDLLANRDVYLFLKKMVIILRAVAFVPTVCWSGRTDHLYCWSLSSRPQEGLPQRNLHSCDVLHKLYPWTCHGNESKFANSHAVVSLHSYIFCSLCLEKEKTIFGSTPEITALIFHMPVCCYIVATKYGFLPHSRVTSCVCEWNNLECHFPFSSLPCLGDVFAPVKLCLYWFGASILVFYCQHPRPPCFNALFNHCDFLSCYTHQRNN